MRSRLALLALVLVVAGAGVAIALTRGGGAKPQRVLLPAVGDAGSEPTSHVSFLEKLIPPPAQHFSGPVAPRSLADLARRLPLERAVAQLFLVGFDGTDTTAPAFDALRRLDLGGVVLDSRNYDNPQQLAALAAAVPATAQRAMHIPPWVMAEQDGGDYSQFSDLPPAHAPGDFHSATNAAAALAAAMAQLKALGLNGLLEPDLDVLGGPDSAIGTEAFSGDPSAVADYARLAVAACQRQRLFCAAKHFPGIGAASTDTTEGPAQVGLSMSDLQANDLVPFAAAVKAGIPGVLVGEGLYEPDSFVTPAALSKAIIGGVLRRRLRFTGVAITDDLAKPGVSSLVQIPDAAVQAFQAGADMVYISGALGDQEAAYEAVLNAVRDGRITETRIRQSLLRVLLTKRAYGLLR